MGEKMGAKVGGRKGEREGRTGAEDWRGELEEEWGKNVGRK